MSKCPYTWFKGIFSGSSKNSTEAKNLRVEVSRNQEVVVDVALPAQSARWLIDLIPDDVIRKIKDEGIPIERIQEDLSQQDKLVPVSIFELIESHRKVSVWLE